MCDEWVICKHSFEIQKLKKVAEYKTQMVNESITLDIIAVFYPIIFLLNSLYYYNYNFIHNEVIKLYLLLKFF